MKSIATKLAEVLRNGGMVVGLLVATTADAHAYVDPGTGVMLLQIIGAIVAGALFYFRQLRDWIASWFSRLTSKPADKAEPK